MTSSAEQGLIRVLLETADAINALSNNLEAALNRLVGQESDEDIPGCEPIEERNPYDNTHPSGLYALGYSWETDEGGFGTIAYWDGVRKIWFGNDVERLPLHSCKGPYQDPDQAWDAARGYEW
jgi:hypothetical protein